MFKKCTYNFQSIAHYDQVKPIKKRPIWDIMRLVAISV